MTRGRRCGVMNRGRGRVASPVHVSNKGKRGVIDADEAQGLFGCRHGNRGNCHNGCADITHDCARRIFRPGDHQDGPNPGVARGNRDVDCSHLRMGQW
jgi:hypothetical protein